MKSFQGTANNLDQPIMGIITRHVSNSWFRKNDKQEILCVSEPMIKIPKANAYIISGEITSQYGIKAPFIHGIKKLELDNLNDGDVVRLSGDGKINILYDIKSSHNAIFATNRCNLHCLMCPQPASADTEDMLKNNLSLIRMIDPSKTPYIAITGGEPTLLGEGLLQLIEECKKKLPKTALAILTNGRRLSDIELVRKIALLEHPNLMFAIPLYSDNDDIHDTIVGVPGSFYETIKGFRNLALFRMHLEIRTVIHALTKDRLVPLAEFIYHNLPFAGHIAFMAVEMTGFARTNADKIWIDPYDYSDELEQAVRYLHRADMNVSIYNHQLCTLPSSLWSFSRKSISDWKNSYLGECDNCGQKSNCGGFFETGSGYNSKHINSIKINQ